MIRLKRAYEPPSEMDGYRVLIDRLWPRGVKKEDLALDAWLKEIAPSTELRKWFAHDPEKWQEFCTRYVSELQQKEDAIATLREKSQSGTLTLVFSAKDIQHNDAVVLKQYLTSLNCVTSNTKAS